MLKVAFDPVQLVPGSPPWKLRTTTVWFSTCVMESYVICISDRDTSSLTHGSWER